MKVKLFYTLTAATATFLLFYPVLQIVLLSLNKIPYLRIGGEFIPTIESFQWVLQQPDFWRGLLNSIIVAGTTVVIVIALALPAAYAFSRYSFKGRNSLLSFYVVFTQVSGGLGIAGLIALFAIVSALGLRNNLLALALIYAAGAIPYHTWLLKTYIDTVPKSAEEAAIIDGAGVITLLTRVVFPIMAPALAVSAILTFIGAWGELILANLFLSGENRTLILWIYSLMPNVYSVQWNRFAAAALLYAIPPVVLYVLLQRFLKRGLTYVY
ncbi:maltooligosaccharide ABC transporter membrane protein [Pyrobaculum islandicum DSM 4184]|uniref:Maltooligosaccharide ABC transporter membrane protein n=1 Tax=Pyrobaculum islandicum (strain DSM 4184 / JCM 9189 / GEO3) TaxID=384616 RepID=A1RT81_PYRIL|nr:ABC transporter permease subunit [Pyrobaculum islandicum]ABL88163.1 maltooligosaccharide ABC transporter membrane protein [Pyrobaculum islandicum DSM 4184]